MTFTEAAVEILRRAGKPLHFKQIAQDAVTSGLLSHVGQTPEATMGARLLAMARREHDRKVVATDTGVFALAEWGLVAQTPLLEAPQPETEPEQPYRARERHPPLQEEFAVGGRREERRRGRGEEDEEGRRKKRYPPPADVAHAVLRERNEPLSLAELAAALRQGDKIAEALERDLHSLERALKEENRRRQDSGRALLFEFVEEGKVAGLEVPKEAPREKRGERREERAPKAASPVEVRPVGIDEQRRQVLRSVRRRISSLDLAALERVAVALLENQGYRELNMARRSAKEGPLYLARRKWGAGELRYAVRVLKPGRDLGRNEVQELRRDLGHYSAQLGIVLGTGECSREAKSEANVPNSSPVMLYGAEAFAEALVDAGLGVTKKLIEWVEYDDEFFAQMGGGEPAPIEEVEEAAPAAPAAPEPREGGESRRRGRDRDRDRRRERRRDERPAGDGASAEAPAESAPSSTEAASAPAEGAPAPVPSEPVAASAPPMEASQVEAPAPLPETLPAPVEPAPERAPEPEAAAPAEPGGESSAG